MTRAAMADEEGKRLRISIGQECSLRSDADNLPMRIVRMMATGNHLLPVL